MKPRQRLRNRAEQEIRTLIKEAKFDGAKGRDLVRYVRTGYRGSKTDGFYQVWLEQFRLIVLGRTGRFPRFGRRRPDDAPGQALLFVEDEGGGS